MGPFRRRTRPAVADAPEINPALASAVIEGLDFRHALGQSGALRREVPDEPVRPSTDRGVRVVGYQRELSCLAQLLFCVFEILTAKTSPCYLLPQGSQLSQPIWPLSFLAPPLTQGGVMEHTIKDDCTHAYVGIVLLVTIFMVLVGATMHGQELPNAPQAAVKRQTPPVHKQCPLLAQPGNLYLGSADWFREREHFKLAMVIPLLTHIDWNLSFGKPKEAGHGNRKSR